MSKGRSKWWWVLGLGVAALFARRSCTSEQSVDAVLHVKLAPGATVLDSEPLFDRSAAELAEDRVAASVRAGQPMPDLGSWREVHVRGDRSAIDHALAELRARPDVVSAFEAPRAELPVMLPEATPADGSCPIKTPPYHELQGYLQKAPGGIDAPAAWSKRGGHGDKVWFADVEGAWNEAHEDVPGKRIKAIGRPVDGRDWEMHGTAVLGEVASQDNGLGMFGIAPDVARIVTSSVQGVSAAKAIDRAQAKLRPGDVLLIELHAVGPRDRFLPMEYWDDVFEVIQIATARGVVVVEAGGNGAENLDHEAYDGKLDRKKRDSGAIMVGAGAPAVKGYTDRSRLDFSNYGSRVDVQGWGRMVATLDYGDLQGCDVTRRKYTNLFGGTSSASPIVAGAALLVESMVKTQKRCAMAPKDLRALLVATGSPQTDGPHGPKKQSIGPRPDLSRIVAKLAEIPDASDDHGDDDALEACPDLDDQASDVHVNESRRRLGGHTISRTL